MEFLLDKGADPDLAPELGVDVNAANTDSRTALNAARALRYGTVVRFLVLKDA